MKLRTGAALAVLIAFAAACKDSTSPTLPDAVGLTDDITAAESLFFTAPAVVSFGQLGTYMTPSGTAIARVSTKLAAALRPTGAVPAGLAPRRAPAPEQQRAVRDFIAALSPAGPVIPDTLYGLTFEWDTATNQYADTGRAGAPATGVRFMLYRVDDATGFPVEPTEEVGYVDFIDESGIGGLALRIQVYGVGGDPQYLDYVLTATLGTGSFSFSATGTVTNGNPSDPRTLTFTIGISEAYNGPDTTVTVTSQISWSPPGITVQMSISARDHETADTITINFSVTREGETVSLQGFLVDDTGDGWVDLTVRVNGRVFARARGTSSTAEFRKANGDRLTQAEAEAVIALILSPFILLDHFDEIFNPGEAVFRP